MQIDQLPADASGGTGAPVAGSLVAKQVARFAGFADDQYLDAVALFAALSTRLRTAGSYFVKIDDDTAQHVDNDRGCAVAVLWLLPSVRRIMGWWWVGPAMLLGVMAVIRWVTGGQAV